VCIQKKVEFVEGSGEKLGELPRVEFQLQKTHADDLKPLHRLLYDRVGAVSAITVNLTSYCKTMKKNALQLTEICQLRVDT
jgi:hypothetical protein